MKLDLNFVRSQFPALDTDFIFMDNAGGSHTCLPTINRITEYLSTINVQKGASYSYSQRATSGLNDSLKEVQQWINASRIEEVVIGSSSTALIRNLSITLSRNWLAGDEIIVTDTEHEANASCWNELRQKGIVVRTWGFNIDTKNLEIADLEKLLNEKTRFVTMCHVSNIFGTVNDIESIGELVHKAGALFCVDGVAYAPHRRVDVQKFKADFYIFSCYKVYGPHIGLMYGRYELLQELSGLNHYFVHDIPYKLQPGNYNYELTYGLAGVCHYLQALMTKHDIDPSKSLNDRYNEVYQLMIDHEYELFERIINFLESRDEIQIISANNVDLKDKISTIAFVHDNMKSDDIVRKIDAQNIGTRFGDFYAKDIVSKLGLDINHGVVRVSLVHYNTMEEVDRLIEVLEEVF